MSFSIHQLAVQQFHDLPAAARLVILHPNYTQQHRLLYILLQQAECAYVRFEGDWLNSNQLKQQLAAALQMQGLLLEQTLHLILDECDRGIPAEFDRFLQQTFHNTPRCRIIVLTRATPRIVLEDTTMQSATRFIPADPDIMLWDYAQRGNSSQSALLEVRALGKGSVLLNGQPVDAWDGMLPRSLFFYMVDRGMTTRNDIFETFWRSLSTRDATNVFHVTKRKISEVLKTDLTIYSTGFYRIAPGLELSYDASQFFKAFQDAEVSDPEEAVSLLERALYLYRAAFLSSVDMSWVQKRRDELRSTYEDALIDLAELTEQNKDVQRSLGLYLRASRINPQREDVVFNIMRLYLSLGHLEDAVSAYDRLQATLKATLNVEPGHNLKALNSEILEKLRRGSDDLRRGSAD